MIKMNPTILLLFLVGCGGQASEHAGHDDHEAHPPAPAEASGEDESSGHAAHAAHEHSALPATEGMARQATLHDLDVVFTDASDVIAQCGSGVSACVDLLAMEHAGLGRGRLYVGSWSQYAFSGRPIATGR